MSIGLAPFVGRLSEDDLPVVLLFVAFATFACILPAQADTFYHLRSGLEMWTSGSLLTREQFSWTEFGKPLPNHWWLSQLAFYGAYAIGGPLLLTVLAGSLAFAATFLSWRLVTGSYEVRLVSLLALALTLTEWSVRPQIFSLLLTVVAIRLVLADRLAWLPPLLVLWANMHAVVVLGIGIAAVPFVDAVLWDRTRTRRTLMVAVASAMAPIATPLGVHYWSWLIETVRVSRTLDLHEYRSAFSLDIAALAYWGLLAVLTVGLVRNRRSLPNLDRRVRLMVLAAVLLAPPAVTSVRNIPFFVLAAVPALSHLLPTRVSTRIRPASRVAWAMMAAAIIAGATVIATKWNNGGERLGWSPIGVRAAAAIRSCPEPMYNGLYEGGQLIWFVPERRVFMDGRVDVYPVQFLLRGRRADVSGEYRELFRDYGIRCAVVQVGTPLFAALQRDQAMPLTFNDSEWAVFSR